MSETCYRRRGNGNTPDAKKLHLFTVRADGSQQTLMPHLNSPNSTPPTETFPRKTTEKTCPHRRTRPHLKPKHPQPHPPPHQNQQRAHICDRTRCLVETCGNTTTPHTGKPNFQQRHRNTPSVRTYPIFHPTTHPSRTPPRLFRMVHHRPRNHLRHDQKIFADNPAECPPETRNIAQLV